jgi:glycosyltransferase involved in cell wall biosynthesis
MISVIIPTLNEAHFLPGLLACLKPQLPPGSEIIVSDGASTDATVRIARNNGCLVVRSNKRSPAAQRNTGARTAHGDVLLFLDADTRIRNDFIRLALGEFTRRNLDAAAFYFTFHSDKILYRIFSYGGYAVTAFATLIHPLAVGAGILVKKKSYEQVNGFDETILIGEDHEFCLRVKKSHARFGLIRSTDILFSPRRFDKEGPWTVMGKWFFYAGYYILKGPIRREVLPYTFGAYSPAKAE